MPRTKYKHIALHEDTYHDIVSIAKYLHLSPDQMLNSWIPIMKAVLLESKRRESAWILRELEIGLPLDESTKIFDNLAGSQHTE